MAEDIDITGALAQVILGLNLVPYTTLTAPASVGDATLAVASTAGFPDNGILAWWDAVSEERKACNVVDATHLSVDSTGLGYAGLQSAHAAGAKISTNLIPYAPNQTGTWLATNYPWIFLLCVRERRFWKTQIQYQSIYTFQLEYHLNALRPAGVKLNTNVFADRIQTRAKTDVGLMLSAIAGNPKLKLPDAQHAQGLGDPSGAQPFSDTQWYHDINNNENQQFAAVTFVTIQGFPRTSLTI